MLTIFIVSERQQKLSGLMSPIQSRGIQVKFLKLVACRANQIVELGRLLNCDGTDSIKIFVIGSF
jgi:hypothetical protein